ncbi:MAG TPA: DUF362 domain-containing protein [Tepidisphaeraceae bacterium]|nr:DUF362 domain-containing protein [Tepidisphaeraceae bacterium]
MQVAAATPLLGGPVEDPKYKVVTPFKPSPNPGMPGPYPGQVVRVHSQRSVDVPSDQVDRAVVKEMLATGMKALTGDSDESDAWRKFISPTDVVGIKVNCSGAPRICSAPEIVGGIAENLVKIGVLPSNIYVYERFENQLVTVPYLKFLPEGAHLWAAETSRGSILGYDPRVYLETSFFGEEDTRSNLVRLVSEKLTKIINVPNAKEHQAAGVTGCLKNVAYGDFSNMDRSHRFEQTNTRTFIGMLASTEPVRSRVVLNIMDALRGVWHQGPFSRDERFRFYPKQIMFGTDPVAMDHKLLDLIEEKRKAEGATSLWERSREFLGDNKDPKFNRFIREPGHIEYASTLGLGVYDNSKIKLRVIEL